MSRLYESPSLDPWHNLAVEEVLLKKAEHDVILYLWQNAHTVVIGKNQNPWKECKTTLLEQEGGRLARRLSGGGAVYHDLGNLNFTILLPRDRFDLARQMAVIRDAAAAVGVEAVLSGRNDVLAGGRKFSGNAFYKGTRAAYHHGTLLVNADMEKLGRYLSPDRKKLQSKGVDSVPSRVVNLADLALGLTVERMKQAMVLAFEARYGKSASLSLTEEDLEEIRALEDRNSRWQWNYGQRLPFTVCWEDRFSWGGIQIGLQVENGTVRTAKVYTDAMDAELASGLEQKLTGCRFTASELAAAVTDLPVAEDLRSMIRRQEL